MEDTNNTSVNELAVLLDLSQTEKDLAETEQAMANVVHDVKTKTGMKAAKADVSKLRGMRTTVDKVRLEAGRVLLSLKKVNDDKAKVLIERIVKLEQPLKDQIDAYEAEQEAIRLAALQAEQDRIDGHRATIAAWRNLPGDLVGRPLAGMKVALSRLESETVISFDVFEEFQQEAEDVHTATIARVRDLIAQAEAAEAERERQRQRDAEFEAQQEALRAANERAAQLEREAEERRQADLRREREEQGRAEAVERKRVADILDRIQYIRDWNAPYKHLADCDRAINQLNAIAADDGFDYGEYKDSAEQAWGEAIEAISMHRADLVKQIDEAEQAEQQRQAELARLQQEREEADARAAEAERARREQALQAEEERQQALTFRKAAQALVDWCVSQGHGHVQVVEDMNAMLLVTEGDLVPTKRQPRKPVKVSR